MHERSEQINELAKALSALHGDTKNVLKDVANDFYKSKYADLASILEMARPLLSKHGLSVVQMPGMDNDVVTLETLLMHTSGQWISSTMRGKPVKSDPQGIGSCVTYFRRYAVSAVLQIAQDDDDGNGASDLKPPSKPNQPKKQQPVAPPWSQYDIAEAHEDLDTACTTLMNAGVIEEDIQSIIDKAKSVIGDSSVPLDRWKNRLGLTVQAKINAMK